MNQAGGAGVEQTKQTSTHHDCDQQLRKIKGGQQGNQTVEGGICADEQGNYHQQDGESDANAQQNRNCILTQFSAVAEGIHHTLKGRCQFAQADAKGRKEAVADGPQPVGRKPVLPRHKAQTQIDAHKQKQQQHEFYETVIATGEAGCNDHAQKQKRQAVSGDFAAPGQKVAETQGNAQNHADGKAQVGASIQGAVGSEQTAKYQQDAEDQLPFLCIKGQWGRAVGFIHGNPPHTPAGRPAGIGAPGKSH